MHNWYGIETEAAFRRQEWERASAAEARAPQAIAGRQKANGWTLPRVSLAKWRAVTAPRAPLGSPLPPRRETAPYPAK